MNKKEKQNIVTNWKDFVDLFSYRMILGSQKRISIDERTRYFIDANFPLFFREIRHMTSTQAYDKIKEIYDINRDELELGDSILVKLDKVRESYIIDMVSQKVMAQVNEKLDRLEKLMTSVSDKILIIAEAIDNAALIKKEESKSP